MDTGKVIAEPADALVQNSAKSSAKKWADDKYRNDVFMVSLAISSSVISMITLFHLK